MLWYLWGTSNNYPIQCTKLLTANVLFLYVFIILNQKPQLAFYFMSLAMNSIYLTALNIPCRPLSILIDILTPPPEKNPKSSPDPLRHLECTPFCIEQMNIEYIQGWQILHIVWNVKSCLPQFPEIICHIEFILIQWRSQDFSQVWPNFFRNK